MLTPLELVIMKAVWQRPPITVRNVQASIRPLRKLAYTTVLTIMDRLYHKGFLTRTFQGRTHLYLPTGWLTNNGGTSQHRIRGNGRNVAISARIF